MMGYFPNGSAGADYQDRFCDHCVHDENNDCPVWLAHLLYNGRDCNDDESILHLLIPFTKDKLGNEQCLLFVHRKDGEPIGPPPADEKYREWLRSRESA